MSGSGSSGFKPRFFVSTERAPALAEPGADAAGRELTLEPCDSRHARAVLRLQPGDACEVVIGAAVYAASVSTVGSDVAVRLGPRLEDALAGAVYQVEVGLVQAVARPAVMDYVFEKGTEVGASFFVLMTAAGSPKWTASPNDDRLKRWGRIVREAAKQSKQVSVPPLVFAGSVDDALQCPLVARCHSVVLDPAAPRPLDELMRDSAGCATSNSPLALWIGPEGGWTLAESQRFASAELATARLGRSVLRTETAGLVALAVARIALGDW